MRTFRLLLLVLCLWAVAASALVVETDRDLYFIGDWVTVTITNNGVGPVEFMSWPPFCPYYVEGGYHLDCVGLPVITTLLPGESVAAGHDTGARPDAPGHYIIQLPGASAIYELLQPVEREASTWGALKSLYR